MEIEKMLDHSSEEYRSAWLKNLQGKELNEVEKRAPDRRNFRAARSDREQGRREILVDTVPLLNEIELFQDARVHQHRCGSHRTRRDP